MMLKFERWKHSLLAVFGVSIPIVTYVAIFSFHLPGPIYFVVATPAYIVFTLHLAKKNKDKSAKKIVGILGAAGFLISLTFSLLAPIKNYMLFETMLYLFPSSVFWMALDAASGPGRGYSIGVCVAAVVVNTLLYSLYGCVLYYLKKLFSKNERLA